MGDPRDKTCKALAGRLGSYWSLTLTYNGIAGAFFTTLKPRSTEQEVLPGFLCIADLTAPVVITSSIMCLVCAAIHIVIHTPRQDLQALAHMGIDSHTPPSAAVRLGASAPFKQKPFSQVPPADQFRHGP